MKILWTAANGTLARYNETRRAKTPGVVEDAVATLTGGVVSSQQLCPPVPPPSSDLKLCHLCLHGWTMRQKTIPANGNVTTMKGNTAEG